MKIILIMLLTMGLVACSSGYQDGVIQIVDGQAYPVDSVSEIKSGIDRVAVEKILGKPLLEEARNDVRVLMYAARYERLVKKTNFLRELLYKYSYNYRTEIHLDSNDSVYFVKHVENRDIELTEN